MKKSCSAGSMFGVGHITETFTSRETKIAWVNELEHKRLREGRPRNYYNSLMESQSCDLESGRYKPFLCKLGVVHICFIKVFLKNWASHPIFCYTW